MSRAPEPESANRDWVRWYEELDDDERRLMRERLIDSGVDDVREDPERRMFFLFHVEDLIADVAPGTRALGEHHHVVMALRGANEPDRVAQRKAAVARMFDAYRDCILANPWLT